MDEILTEGPSEPYSQYEQACLKCIDDLYHTAYLALVDADASEKLVTVICVAGVHKYDIMVSKTAKEHYTSEVFFDFFERYEGKTITLPARFLPSKEMIEYHNFNLKDY